MTITLPEDLERTIAERARHLGLPPDELVRRAVAWYFEVEPELAAELAFWQETTQRAWAKVEESLS